MTRKALGRGLGALLSAEGTATAAEEASEVPLTLIDPGSVQPRTIFDDAKLENLANSIRANGVVQPVLLRRKGDRFELIAGERRWRAAQIAGLNKIPAVVRSVPDDKVLEIALIENIQREDLNPIEEARAYKKLIETLGLTQETVAERVGRDRSYVTNYLRLLKLPDDLQDLLQSGRISTGHARTLLGLDQPDIQRRIARKVIEQDLSVRATEQLVRLSATRPTQRAAKVTQKEQEVDPNVRAAENKLRRLFGTQVRIIQPTGGASGRIELEFYNQTDLNRLYDLLTESSKLM
ncbi:MAG TPA: ParB/RepB/Spo0J family partition protein [Pyrinomonadaceae bacterium]|jgi:ParB family chromosome partitioning protein|nr:ParB/RepB/Spo0J family partition protein [Pyrinomonadaceae bacterium]